MNCERCGKSLRGGPRFPFATLGFSERESARAVGVSGSTWQRYMCHGVLRESAERIADKLGCHPYELWPEMIDHDAGSKPCDDCETPFVPQRPWHRFCTSRCQARARMRRLRAQPDFREGQRGASRRYYEECGDYVRRMRRERYRRKKEQAA